MAEDFCIEGDGGPLVLLQSTVVPMWQGARIFENSVMNGGQLETDYDIICNHQLAEGICVVTRYDRDLLVLWDCEFGATLLPSHLLSLAPDALVFIQCYHPDDLPDLLPQIQECLQQRQPERSLLFNIEDTTLRLQVGADSLDPSYLYGYLDIPVTPGVKRCDVYRIECQSLHEEVVILSEADVKDIAEEP